MVYSVGILTVSDTASKDASLDKSGPTIKEFLSKEQYSVEQQCIVPDSIDEVQKTVKHWTDNLKIDLILLTGGTGFSERDKTPEAIRPLLTRETPGITHLLLSSSISITPMAALSRPVTGIRNKTIIVTFPGSPKACTENLSAIVKILPHALDLLLDLNQKHVKETHTQMQGHQCTHRQNEDDTLIGRSAPLGTPVSRRARHSPYPLISVKEAHHLIEKHVQRLNTVNMPVSQFLGSGYVLADTIKSLEPVPGYRASTVDGYAVYAEDGPGVYKVDSVALAEKQEKVITMHPGTIARVTTGGMIPDGANAVVMLEDTLLTEASSEGEEVKVEILDGATEGQNIREIGSDCSMDSVVGVEGQSVGPSEVALLASVGVRHAKVYRKPVVGVLSSGNEVMEHIHTDTLQPGQIRDTNRLSLLATIRNAGFEASDLGIVSDRVEEIHEAIEEALSRVDVLVTTGGVSMGEADFMKPVLEQKLGATIHFGRVLMKPGKPTTFATVPQGKKSKWVFALPGNPVSASVTFYLFVLPALKRMMGSLKTQAVVVPVKLTDNVKLDSRPEYHRVRVKVGLSGFKVESTGKQISSRVSSMSEANGLLELPAATPEVTTLCKGTEVSCMLIGQLEGY